MVRKTGAKKQRLKLESIYDASFCSVSPAVKLGLV